MLLFRSEGHRDRWLEARGLNLGASLSVKQQWELARVWYSKRMEPDWRRRTPGEAEQVFEGLGLTGEFWRLT
jgi:hypothetical protein